MSHSLLSVSMKSNVCVDIVTTNLSPTQGLLKSGMYKYVNIFIRQYDKKYVHKKKKDHSLNTKIEKTLNVAYQINFV